MIINYIPNYEDEKEAIPTAGVDPLLENDVRIDTMLKFAHEHLDIVILDEISWGSEWWYDYSGSSSSSSPEYPMAEVDIVDATGSDEMIEHILDPMIENYLPGTKKGPSMTSLNFLTMSSHINQSIPGDILETSSSSS